MSSEKQNLYQRINEVRKSITYLQKDKSVSTGGGSYLAVTHDQVTAMVREHMVKHGIVSYPVLVDSVSLPKEVNAAMEMAKQFRYEATYDFHFVNIDDAKDELVIRIQAHAMDNADKAPGKALSYAKKYAILKLFEIETGEDEESRYAGFDVDDWITSIQSAQTIAELQQSYNDAVGAALKAKDMTAKQMIIVAKDKRKAELA